ncbi:MAG: neutral zinc metallopeptidase, partial [Bacteroidales bacterium]|nr:neutral zinc metallopeptidase [Bacteroidales bacterium]
MKLEGRRESTNVDDRRGGSSMGTIGGLGIGGLIIIGLLTWLLGGDPSSVIQEAGQVIGTGSQTAGEYTPTAEEEELARFSKQILAGTEDVWTKIFRQNGLTYEPPKLVLFSGAVQSGCGGATSQSGPF